MVCWWWRCCHSRKRWRRCYSWMSCHTGSAPTKTMLRTPTTARGRTPQWLARKTEGLAISRYLLDHSPRCHPRGGSCTSNLTLMRMGSACQGGRTPKMACRAHLSADPKIAANGHPQIVPRASADPLSGRSVRGVDLLDSVGSETTAFGSVVWLGGRHREGLSLLRCFRPSRIAPGLADSWRQRGVRVFVAEDREAKRVARALGRWPTTQLRLAPTRSSPRPRATVKSCG